MAKQSAGSHDELPFALEYLRAPALRLVGSDNQVVGCGQVDFAAFERAIKSEFAGLTSAQTAFKRAEHRQLMARWLQRHEASDEPLVVGLQFIALLLDTTGQALTAADEDPSLSE